MTPPDATSPAVALDQVWSRYGRHLIHQGISLEVPRGSVCAKNEKLQKKKIQ